MTINSDIICPVCLCATDEALAPLRYTDHTLAHIFHTSCVQRWIELGGTNCPLCRHQIIDLHFLGRDASPQERAIRFAAQNENLKVLRKLATTAEDQAIAILCLSYNSTLVESIIGESKNQEKTRLLAIQMAAYEPNLEKLNQLIQNDEHRALAMASPSLQKPILRAFLIERAENPALIRQMAIAFLATSGNFDQLNELIETDDQRAVAIAALPLSQWRLIDRLLNRQPDADQIRLQATLLALDSNTDILRFLIRNDSDRGLAIAMLEKGDEAKLRLLLNGVADPFQSYKAAFEELSETDIELIEFVIEKADNPQKARLAAIEAAAENCDLPLLQKLILTKENRAYAIGSLPEEGLDLLPALLNDEVEQIAVLDAAQRKNLPILRELLTNDDLRVIAIVFLPADSTDCRLDFLNQAQSANYVRNIAFHVAAKLKLFSILNQLIETQEQYEHVILLLDPVDCLKIILPLERLHRLASELSEEPSAKKGRLE